nr:phosphotransferase [Propionibacterium sp.]
MTGLTTAWWRHLANVRWFGGKGAPGAITALEALPWYTAPDAVPAVRSEIATIDYADGRREFYHLLVAHYPAGAAPGEVLARLGTVDVVDATTDPASVRAFVDACQRRGVPGMTWTVPQPPATEVRVWAGEQSNTTITLDDTSLFKVFRRIEPGPNLDAEVLGALAGSGTAVPALFGRLTADWPAGGTTDLGMVIERVPGARDGWEIATAACAAGTDFGEDARALGVALAAVHAQLAATFGTGTASGDELAATMTRRLDEAVAVAEVLRPHRDALAATVAVLRGRPLTVQRVHGDFHLGQTLRSPAGWTIIDFEGEPAKTAAERRAPDSVWRDVAGMLRSFDYARSAHPEPTSEAARTWSQTACTAFVGGYCGDRDLPTGVLAPYLVDKAVYEVVYETRNRPTWVGIPLQAITELAHDHTTAD